MPERESLGPRERMQQRVREAVRQGNRFGMLEEPGPRGPIGYQGSCGLDLVQGFAQALQCAGGYCHRVAQLLETPRVIIPVLENAGVRRVGISTEAIFTETLQLARRLEGFGFEVWLAGELAGAEPVRVKDACFALDAGITGVDALVAETGTIVLSCSPERPRSLSLLPRLYLAVADVRQIVPDLFDWFGQQPPEVLPSAYTLITGPSKTGDIELTLVTGVHGPGEVHVVLYGT